MSTGLGIVVVVVVGGVVVVAEVEVVDDVGVIVVVDVVVVGAPAVVVVVVAAVVVGEMTVVVVLVVDEVTVVVVVVLEAAPGGGVLLARHGLELADTSAMLENVSASLSKRRTSSLSGKVTGVDLFASTVICLDFVSANLTQSPVHPTALPAPYINCKS